MDNDIVQKHLTYARKENEGLGLNHTSDKKKSYKYQGLFIVSGATHSKMVLNLPETSVFEQHDLTVKESLPMS